MFQWSTFLYVANIVDWSSDTRRILTRPFELRRTRESSVPMLLLSTAPPPLILPDRYSSLSFKQRSESESECRIWVRSWMNFIRFSWRIFCKWVLLLNRIIFHWYISTMRIQAKLIMILMWLVSETEGRVICLFVYLRLSFNEVDLIFIKLEWHAKYCQNLHAKEIRCSNFNDGEQWDSLKSVPMKIINTINQVLGHAKWKQHKQNRSLTCTN